VTISDERTGVDADAFTENLQQLTVVFGDPTRRAIFFHVLSNPGTTANELSEQFAIHANVARHHLERLEQAGYVTSDDRRSTGVGRPSKAYRVINEPAGLGATSDRRDALLVRLLELAIDLLGADAAEAMALEVGQSYGMELASEIDHARANDSVRDALGTVAAALTAHGFSARANANETNPSLEAMNCPFGDAAAHHPVLCAVDRGLVSGMLEGLGAKPATVTLTSRARGDDACRTEF